MQLPDQSEEFWNETVNLSEFPDNICNDILENFPNALEQPITRLMAITAWLEWNGIIGFETYIIDLFVAVTAPDFSANTSDEEHEE
jgi:hypothetical protein